MVVVEVVGSAQLMDCLLMEWMWGVKRGAKNDLKVLF